MYVYGSCVDWTLKSMHMPKTAPLPQSNYTRLNYTLLSQVIVKQKEKGTCFLRNSAFKNTALTEGSSANTLLTHYSTKWSISRLLQRPRACSDWLPAWSIHVPHSSHSGSWLALIGCRGLTVLMWTAE